MADLLVSADHTVTSVCVCVCVCVCVLCVRLCVVSSRCVGRVTLLNDNSCMSSLKMGGTRFGHTWLSCF